LTKKYLRRTTDPSVALPAPPSWMKTNSVEGVEKERNWDPPVLALSSFLFFFFEFAPLSPSYPATSWEEQDQRQPASCPLQASSFSDIRFHGRPWCQTFLVFVTVSAAAKEAVKKAAEPVEAASKIPSWAANSPHRKKIVDPGLWL